MKFITKNKKKRFKKVTKSNIVLKNGKKYTQDEWDNILDENDKKKIKNFQMGNWDGFNCFFYEKKSLICSFVDKNCRVYYNKEGLKRDDLLQLGYMGFVKSIKTFDFSKNSKYITYLYNCLYYGVQNEIRDYSFIKKPRSVKSKCSEYMELKANCNKKGLTDNDIAKKMNLTTKELEKIKEIFTNTSCPLSLDVDNGLNFCGNLDNNISSLNTKIDLQNSFNELSVSEKKRFS